MDFSDNTLKISPQCPRNHFSNGTLLIHKVYFVDGIKRNATYAYPMYVFFFFFISALGENQNLKFFIKDTSAEVDILYYIKDI